MAKVTLEGLDTIIDEFEGKKLLLEKKLEATGLTATEKSRYDSELALTNLDIVDARKKYEDLEEAELDVLSAKFWAADKVAIEKAIIDNSMGYIIPENRLIYCKDFGRTQSNAGFKMVEGTVKKMRCLLEKLCGAKLRGFDEYKLIGLFQTLGKDYLDQTSSFNQEKWNDELVYNQSKIIMKYWIQPDFINAENYNKDFDILMHCVGGGKAENIKHLEIWPAYKWMYPERLANTPNLDCGGQPGGNGKGRYVKMHETIFTPVCVIEGAAKEIVAGFNANWTNAVVIHYDEPEENELPNSKIKNSTGGESQRIERKGIDAYMADRNYNFIFTSNNENGVVILVGVSSGEDRRYSVVSTNIVMVQYIMEKEKVDLETAKKRTNQIAQMVKDPKEVAKWLAHCIVKHDVANIEVLQPLHGIDYKNRFQDQKTTITCVFDLIYPIYISQGFIGYGLLHDIVISLTNNNKWTERGVGKEFKRYLKNRGHLPYVISKQRVDYIFNGISIYTFPKDRAQTSVISDTPVLLNDQFNYNLVSTKTINAALPLSEMTCVLRLI